MTGTAATAIDIAPTATTGATTGVPNVPSATIENGATGATDGGANGVGMSGGEATGNGERNRAKPNRLRKR